MKNYLPKLLITGGHGQLAMALRNHVVANQFDFILCSHEQMDITQPTSIENAISRYHPDIIINTAAYTAVDKAESEVDAAMQTNYFGAKNIAIACHKNHIPLLHISTAYVFDGHQSLPYRENDIAKPLSIYGESKWLGEEAVRQYHSQHIILRVTSVFSEYRHNFLKSMLMLAQQKKEMQIVVDQITTPTYAGDIAGVILHMATQLTHYGTYHYCNMPPVSWHAFANAIINEAKCHRLLSVENVKPITTAEYQTAAKRPFNSVMNCDKIKKDYDITLIHWESAVKLIVKSLLTA